MEYLSCTARKVRIQTTGEIKSKTSCSWMWTVKQDKCWIFMAFLALCMTSVVIYVHGGLQLCDGWVLLGSCTTSQSGGNCLCAWSRLGSSSPGLKQVNAELQGSSVYLWHHQKRRVFMMERHEAPCWSSWSLMLVSDVGRCGDRLFICHPVALLGQNRDKGKGVDRDDELHHDELLGPVRRWSNRKPPINKSLLAFCCNEHKSSQMAFTHRGWDAD